MIGNSVNSELITAVRWVLSISNDKMFIEYDCLKSAGNSKGYPHKVRYLFYKKGGVFLVIGSNDP